MVAGPDRATVEAVALLPRSPNPTAALDGVNPAPVVHEANGSRVEQMTSPQRFIVNLWNTEQLYRWTGRVRPSEAPWTLHVACVAQAREYSGRSLCAPADSHSAT